MPVAMPVAHVRLRAAERMGLSKQTGWQANNNSSGHGSNEASSYGGEVSGQTSVMFSPLHDVQNGEDDIGSRHLGTRQHAHLSLLVSFMEKHGLTLDRRRNVSSN